MWDYNKLKITQMKKITTIIVILCFSLYASAQTNYIKNSETQILIDGIAINVISSELFGNTEDVQDEWKSYIKDQLDANMKEKDGVFTLKEVQVNNIINKRADLLAYIYAYNNKVSFNFTLKLGYDIYLNSTDYPEEFTKANAFVTRFISLYYTEYLPKKIKDLNKAQTNLERQLKKSNRIIKKSKKNNSKLLNKNNNPKPKTNLEVNKGKMNMNTSTIESRKILNADITPKIESLKAKINTFEIILKNAEMLLKVHEVNSEN